LNILKLSKLDKIQIADISKLAKQCGDYDPYYEEFSASGESCFFLYYNDMHLVSFLSFLSVASTDLIVHSDKSTIATSGSTVIPKTTTTQNTSAMESEITAMTLPSERRRGLFTELLKCALTELNILGITNIYCAVPPKYQNSSLCKGISHIEYLQRLDNDSSSEFSSLSDVNSTANRSEHSSSQSLIKSKNIQFTYSPSEGSNIPSSYQLIEKHFLMRSKIIGLCQLSEESQFTNLWGVEIKKPYRNQGYGLKLMSFVIHDYFKCTSKPLILNVTSKNSNACKLYRRCGFKIVEQIEYFKLLD